jgi:hypothetical protein
MTSWAIHKRKNFLYIKIIPKRKFRKLIKKEKFERKNAKTIKKMFLRLKILF